MDFKTHLINENIKRILVLGAIYTLFELVGLTLSTLGVFELDIRLYVAIIVLFHIIILSGILITKEFNIDRYNKLISTLYVFVILLWSVVLTGLVYLENHDITVIVLVLLITSTFIVIDYKMYGIFLGITFAFFAFLTIKNLDQQNIINELIFRALIFYTLSYTICRYNYKNKESSFKVSEQLKVNNLYLEERSKRDSLSGLYNNAYIYEYLDEILTDVKPRHLAVLMLDLDNFKGINDQYGHLFGDQVIKKVADQLNISTGPNDILGRYGGEEFIVIINKGDISHSVEIAEAIRVNIENLEFKIPVQVTISIGIAINNNDNARSLIKKADEQLYRAKALGKNRVAKEEVL